jgi:hypothetical protein
LENFTHRQKLKKNYLDDEFSANEDSEKSENFEEVS